MFNWEYFQLRINESENIFNQELRMGIDRQTDIHS